MARPVVLMIQSLGGLTPMLGNPDQLAEIRNREATFAQTERGDIGPITAPDYQWLIVTLPADRYWMVTHVVVSRHWPGGIGGNVAMKITNPGGVIQYHGPWKALPNTLGTEMIDYDISGPLFLGPLRNIIIRFNAVAGEILSYYLIAKGWEF